MFQIPDIPCNAVHGVPKARFLKKPDAFQIHGALRLFRRQVQQTLFDILGQRRALLQRQTVGGKMIRFQREGLPYLRLPIFQRLAGQAPHQIKTQIAAPGLADGPERRPCLLDAVHPAERMQPPIVERLDAEGNPVDPGVQKAPRLLFGMQGVGIGLHADLGVGAQRESPPHALQHGGQSIPNFEYGLALGVAKTFIKELYVILDLRDTPEKDEVKAELRAYLEENESILDGPGLDFVRRTLERRAPGLDIDFAVKKALEYTEKATYQAMEALVHNLNTMHSRAGAQIPFSSINYGTDTSPEGRMVIKNVLLATEAGLGNGETPIFPIHIFKVKEGVNFREGDPNYDLFKLACRVSAKRLFPNFSFIDAPFNKAYYRPGQPETEIAYMGCRTRVMANLNDPSREIVNGRGNLSFTSINLPRLGILADRNLDAFFSELDKMVDLVFEQLLERLEIQSCKKCKNYPFLMGQGVWIDSDGLAPDDEVREVLKHGTLTVGFIGLAECLKALIGKHHGESEEAQELGLRIVRFIREKADKKAAETKLNFSVIATPAEGLSGKFVRLDRKRFGSIEGITDKDYYTNSFHIPVYYNISAYNKIRLEAPYHALTNGGHITYVEVDGDPSNNLEAFEDIIRAMKEMGIGYGSINHPVDRDPVCGFTGIIGDVCPRCGRHDGEGVDIDGLRRIKGYVRDARSEEERAESRDRTPNVVM